MKDRITKNLAAQLRAAKPLLDDAQVSAAVSKIMATTGVTDMIRLGGMGPEWFTTPEGARHLIDQNAARIASDIVEAPSADDVRQHLTEQWRKSNGEPMPDIRLRLHREATSMTADERIASGAKPNSAVVKNQPPSVHPEVYDDPSEAQADAWDLEIQRRWGHPPGTILASKRRQLIDAMKSMPPTASNLHQHLASQPSDSLTARQRLDLHRLNNGKR